MKSIQIDLPGVNYRYQVKIGSNYLSAYLPEFLTLNHDSKIFVITNRRIQELYPRYIENIISRSCPTQTLVLPDGEETKSLETVTRIYDFLVSHFANRGSMLIAFGGGVIGDIVGFAAATFMRGISFIQIPTTLLSQVDSGIGGKTGINHKAGKNLIGAFKQPLQTMIDVEFLKTLPERELVAGYAELIKHGLIRDAYLFQILKQKTIEELKTDHELLMDAVFRSCEVKARVVESDEKESNQRAILNFGHTLGHFLETLTNYQLFLHGEAVIIGMDFAAWWSYQRGTLDKKEYFIIHEHLECLGVQQKIPNTGKDEFIRIVGHDKKSNAKGIQFIGLAGIGQARICEGTKAENLWEDLLLYVKTSSLLEFSGVA